MIKYHSRMLYLIKIIIAVLIIHFTQLPFAQANTKGDLPLLDFNFYKKGQGSPVVLIIGGIQGDEPGGFYAASLLAMHYNITSGTVWIVPNLNFHSIIKRSRGIYGDMNRKFAKLNSSDPEYSIVSRIQNIIRSSEVKLVLNLHDGSGFFRPENESDLYSPRRWGQSIIIDQEYVDDKTPLGNLGNVAEKVASRANLHLLRSQHKYHIRNTHTAKGDNEMEKSLTWYAVLQGKAAFGLEASKEFTSDIRAYYHLLVVEGFLNEAGITYTRDFELTTKGVAKAIKSDLNVTFADNRAFLPLDDIRPNINYFPLPYNDHISAIGSNPLLTVQAYPKELKVHYGNRTLTSIKPDWRKFDNKINSVIVNVDNEERKVTFCQIVNVKNSFKVNPIEGYRVNAIGVASGKKDESDITIKLSSFIKRFSVDRKGTLFRVEIYNENDFAGMFLVRFVK